MELPDTAAQQKRVVIVGAGFAGLTLAKRLAPKYFQVVLLDKNNYHQFQPLLYQVAAAGLEPSSISFPLRKIFQKRKNVFIRIADVKSVATQNNLVQTSIGDIGYDYLVLANGAETNYFEMNDLQQNAFSMKSVSEALLLRNTLLQNYEQALTSKSEEEKSALLNIVIVGGGPTGVELAGAIAEMKDKILPKDYPELNFGQMNIYLVEAAPRLLNGMSETSGKKVEQYLSDLGVLVKTNISVKNYNGHAASLSNNNTLYTRCLIWAAGVKGAALNGLPGASVLPNKRILVDEFNRIEGLQNVFAIGDIALMKTGLYQKGHPQVAPVAMQQASLLAKNLLNAQQRKELKPFIYKDKGSMATVGRNLAVAELGKIKIKGFIAWVVWMMVHLMSIIGVKNRLFILINWIWQYVTYDQSLRLIIRPSERKSKPSVIKNQDSHFHKQLAGVR
ncbi:MAG TPA: NAD(P)/FAD-dependent oxidoreductase [Flavisolibacter sp.]|jgi:NADH dehydrogenase|nr:NAD(P)/FAD-dependent oxidoreductase [Flavisolibacter sp.]